MPRSRGYSPYETSAEQDALLDTIIDRAADTGSAGVGDRGGGGVGDMGDGARSEREHVSG